MTGEKSKRAKDKSALTHIDSKGEARMVDVSTKPATERTAVAEGRVVMSKATLELIVSGNARKGDVFGTARVAGIMAAKRTSDLIPLCHPLALSNVTLDITPDKKLPGCIVRDRKSTRLNSSHANISYAVFCLKKKKKKKKQI